MTPHTRRLRVNCVLLCLFTLACGTFAAAASWSNSASMNSPRANFTLTALKTGRALAIGGQQRSGSALNSAEMYNPQSNTWTYTGSMQQARTHHTATVLNDGTVLVIGGDNGNGQGLASAEIYSPVSGRWTTVGSMHVGRTGHTAVLLPSGKVLVVSATFDGIGSYPKPELYDPASRSFRLSAGDGLGQMSALLPTGKVLTRGFMNEVIDQWYLYDPATDRFTEQFEDWPDRTNGRGLLLRNGQFLITGGFLIYTPAQASCEVFDPNTSQWLATGDMIAGRFSHVLVMLPNGHVLAAGGTNGINSLKSAELYDPDLQQWTATSSLTQARENAQAVVLTSGRVLVAGGKYASGVLGTTLATTETYIP